MAQRWRWALVAALAVLLVCAWAPWSQEAARQHSEAGLKRALATYAAARAINAVISVAQSAQVSFQPGGIGVATNPGEALDPLNDLIEQFSSVMLMASVAFGIQLLLTEVGAHHLVSLALSAVILGCMATLLRTGQPPRWLTKALVVLLLVRFAMPIAVMASEGVHAVLFQQQYETAASILNKASAGGSSAQTSGAVESEPQARGGDWFPWRKKTPEEAKPAADAADGVISRMQAFFKDGVMHVVTLAALFIVHTIAMPLLVLWLLVATLRAVVLRRPPE